MILFHGTTKEAAAKIKIKGFWKRECSDFGKAAYFSDKEEWANEYTQSNGVVIKCLFSGNILDLSNNEHFEIYRKNERSIPKKFDALKDGHIIAVYNTKSLTIL